MGICRSWRIASACLVTAASLLYGAPGWSQASGPVWRGPRFNDGRTGKARRRSTQFNNSSAEASSRRRSARSGESSAFTASPRRSTRNGLQAPAPVPIDGLYANQRLTVQTTDYVPSDNLSDSFLRGAMQLSMRLGCDARDLLAVMMRESGVRADAHNRVSNASGLIQFLPETLVRLGWAGTPEEFRLLNSDQQLPWVEKFLRPSARYGLGSAARVYLAIFMPSLLPLPADKDTVIIDSAGINAACYSRNRALDSNGDGRITVGELQQAVDRSCASARWREIEDRLGRQDPGPDRHKNRPTVQDRRSAGDDAGAEPSASRHRWSRDDGTPTEIRKESRRWEDRHEPDRAPRGQEHAAFDLGTTDGMAGALRALGYNLSRVSLNSALRSFQRREGLRADGVPGPKTCAAIAAELDARGITASL